MSTNLRGRQVGLRHPAPGHCLRHVRRCRQAPGRGEEMGSGQARALSDSGFRASVRGRLLAATAALGAVVSHESAAELHGLPGRPTGLGGGDCADSHDQPVSRCRGPSIDRLTRTRSSKWKAFRSPTRSERSIDLAAKHRARSVIGRIVDHLVVRRRGHRRRIRARL